ncbi:hypothetical protein [Legionella saoudiensis]|uniref:hypothetical protein n=1 Tax=Legionella saoudiensis TaxID=1750561 RepID=UPI00073184EF|nr:hypothetical protein [Legionella saoudiensis]
MSYLGQGLLIDNLNKEFKKQRFPAQFHFNEGGVCNGLAMVYAQYALQGPEKEAEFFKILQIIADGKQNEEKQYGLHEGAILLFASQVLLAFQPGKYELSQTQSTSMEMLKINGKTLCSSFDFALAAPDTEWSQVIAKIGLQNDEVMIVQSINHAVSVRKLNDKYRIYDPNYASGFKEFASEEALIKELHREVFGYGKGNIGLEVHVVRNPDAAPRQTPFPVIQELYKQHLPSTNATAKIGSKIFNTLAVAATIVKDPHAIEALITQSNASAEEIYTAAKRAVSNNNVAALGPLLEKVMAEPEAPKKLKILLEIAIGTGRLDTYNQLEKYFPECYAAEHLGHLIVLAAKGGNPKILEQVLIAVQPSMKAYVDKLVTDNMENGALTTAGMNAEAAKAAYLHIFLNKNMVEGIHVAIGHAIEKGNTECIKILVDQLRSYNEPLNEKQLFNYFLRAIEHNQPYALEKLIDTHPDMSKEILPLLAMSPLSVKRTNLDVLRVLKQNGVLFSAQAENIIQGKEKDEYRTFSTVINLLINYIQNLFGKKQLNYDEQQLLAMKKNECEKTIKEIEDELADLKETDKDQYEIYLKALNTERKNLDGENDFSNVIRIGNKLRGLLNKVASPIVLNLNDFILDDLNTEDDEQSLEDIATLFDESQEDESLSGDLAALFAENQEETFSEDIVELSDGTPEVQVLQEEVNVLPENNYIEKTSGVINKFKEQISEIRNTETEENQIDIRINP